MLQIVHMRLFKLICSLSFIVLGLIFMSSSVFAHPGNTASDGCHYCRTRCDYWGETWNARHCHGGGSYYSPPSYSPTPYSPPSYPSIPSCPYNAYYDSLSDSCKCSYGYVANSSGSGCISQDQYCRDQNGLFSSYDILSGGCKCDSGYVFDDSILGGSECVSCSSKYGFGATADYISGGCKCSSGYVFDDDIFGNPACVSGDSYCRDLYGFGSDYNSLKDTCGCDSGYELTQKTYGTGLECKSCFSKYGINSKWSYLQEACVCDSGYEFKKDTFGDGYSCVKSTVSNISGSGYDYQELLDILESASCVDTINGYPGSDGTCYCNVGYEWNFEISLCTKVQVDCSSHGSASANFDGLCECNSGYLMRNNVCITHTLDCENTFGPNVSGVKGDGDYSSCNCNTGYEWNNSQTACQWISAEPAQEDSVADVAENPADERLAGKILLQVESYGEAWYVHPETRRRHYMKDGGVAYEMMRSFGLGITDADLELIPAVADKDEMLGSTNYCGLGGVADRVKGKILLQVERLGEAWYVHPDKCRRIYMKDGAAAYTIMRYLSLGITNSDLGSISIGQLD